MKGIAFSRYIIKYITPVVSIYRSISWNKLMCYRFFLRWMMIIFLDKILLFIHYKIVIVIKCVKRVNNHMISFFFSLDWNVAKGNITKTVWHIIVPSRACKQFSNAVFLLLSFIAWWIISHHKNHFSSIDFTNLLCGT